MRGSEVAAIVVSILLVLSPAVAGVTVTSAAAAQADEVPGGSGGENVTRNSTDASTQEDSGGSLRLVGDGSSSPPRGGPPSGKKGGPPSDAGVTKVDSCRVIDSPGRYQVTGQLNVEGDVSEPCIRVTSSDVRLYGERRAITENAAANGTANLVGGETSGGAESIGVYVAPESGESSIRNVIVSDLVVEDWTTGILFENVEKGAVRNNIVTGNHVGVQVYGRQASEITLEGNVLTGNGRAVAMEWATDSRVIDNEISGNLNGVQIAESSDVRVENNNIDANRGKPIELARNSRGNTIRRNALRENANGQITTDSSSRGNRISANAISKSGRDTPVFASSGLMGTENNRARGAERGNASGGAKGNARGAPGNLGVPAEGTLGQFSMANPGTNGDLAAAFADPGFNGTGLSVDLQNPTSLQFGPDDRLYVAQQNGLIRALTVNRVNQTHYNITDVENITAIQDDIPNHDDDGTLNTNVQDRLITGILVTGTAENPVIYVPSSDPRIGGGGNSEDTGLDTNSGTLSKLQWDGSEWDHTLLMRGLPRSEENHHPNGMALDEANDTLYIATGGNTNKGAPSNNFVYLPEYALSAAILSIDLNQIEGMSTEQNANGIPVKYDIPTLQGTEDPFGGQGGSNQATLTENGPIDVYAPGFRNAYDVVLTQDNQMYTVDNGANSDWGGPPVGEGTDGTCTNEPNEDNSFTDNDELHYVSGEGYYGGHPNPTRGNENVYPGAVYSTYDRPIECDYQSAESDDDVLATFTSSTNGLDEYTSTAFGGAMQGDLLAAGFGGNIWRLELDESGSAVTSKTSLFSNFGSKPLDVTAQGNDGPFNGTVWATTYGSSSITVFTPSTNEACLGTDDPSLDEDGDGFSNADEIDNGADPCSAASVPPDNDGDDLSDLNDFDDDNDGVSDLADPFAIDANDGQQLPVSFQFEPGSYAGTLLEMGFTGVMSNGEDNYRDLYDTSRLTAGGAANVLSVDSIPEGSAYEANNDQQYGFQVGVKPEGKQFTARTTLKSPLPDTPVDNQSQGFYVGTGDQDNYVKLVASANGGDGGIQFAKEVDGTFEVVAEPTVTDVTSAQTLDLYMTVDPANDTITAAYSIDGGQNVTVGTTSFPGEWAADPDQGLALGVISTSRGPGDQFSGTWSRLVASSGTLATGNQPPTADFDYSPVSPEAGETIAFDASPSSDVDGSIQSYEWDFDGDGSTDATGPQVTHSYSGTGTESVTLTVTDGAGATDSYTEEIYVEPAGTEDPVTAQIDSCGVIDRPGTYTLTTDIQDSSDTPCLQVTTSDVVIDGAGHTIDGDTSANGSAHVGVLVEQPGTEPETVRNVTVEDLTLTEWNTGIAYRRVADGQVRNNVVSDSITGIQLFGTTANTGHTVTDNTVYDTRRGIAIEGTTDSLFTNNNVSGNYEGLYLLGASGNTIRNHVLESNTRRAIQLDGSGPDNTFQNVDLGRTNLTFQGRNVSVASASNSPDDPDGLDNIDNYVRGEAVGPDAFLDLTIQYAGVDVASVDESTLSLWSYDGSWTEVSGATLDAGANRISANTTQLGILAPLADEPPVAYRVNNGGSELAALDSSIDWEADTSSDPAPYRNDAATNTYSTQNSISLDGSVPDDTPEALFQTERYDPAKGAEMQWEFPVNAGETYEVRLHFAEIFATQSDQRVFDVSVENQLVLDDYDIYADVGHDVGVTKAYQVTPDSTLDVDFGHVVDNPKISGIEIVKLTDNSNNQVPTADISYSAAGETVSFDASGSSDPDGSIQSYAWDFDGDGTTDATGPTPTHTYASGGEKSVTLTVTDEDGAAALVSETVTLTSTNQEPVADFSFVPVGPTVDESTTFDGSESSDVDGSIQSYEWDFDGDGTTDATGPTPTHTYTSSGIKTPELTVTDDDGDSDTVTQCLAVAPANGGTGTDEASVSILPNTGINSSTYSSGSFAVSNTGQTDITIVEFDLSTGKMPDMVFDPNGTAGDKVAKDFSVDTEGGTGYSCHSLAQPHDDDPENGYDVLRVAFTDFEPGETFEFSIDVDPSSIKGDEAPGPAESGSVSGLELTRSTVSTGFESGTTQDATPFSDGSLGGSQAVVKTDVAAAPTIDASGVSLQSTTLSDNHTAATVAGADQTIQVSGPAGATVRLLRLEAGLFTEGVPDGGYDLEAYEGNSVIGVSEQPATIGSDGTVDVGVTLTNSTDAAGLNYITAVVEDADGETGLVSNVIVLRYNPDAATTQPPSAEFSYSPTSPTTGETVSFDASGSSDSDGSIQSYEWDFDGDGTIDETTSSATTSYTYSTTGDKSVTLTVTDDDGATDQTTQTVSVGSSTTEDTVVYRLNNGGSELTASDGSIDWGADTSSNPSTYLNSIEDKTYSTSDSISLDSSVPSSTPTTLFQSERWDLPADPEMQWDFPVDSGATYEVKLHFAEIYYTQDGQRVFDVAVENQVVLDNYDIHADVGHDTGVTKTYQVTSDSTLDIDFGHVTGNPKVSGIEIVKLSSGTSNQAPAADFSYSPSSPTTGETVSFDASASSDSDGSIHSYEWDFDGDGTIDETTSSATTTYTYSSTGDKAVTLTVTDD
ncbi:PKD domain-containing protein, partial [Salinirubellus sp. GCM10025818]